MESFEQNFEIQKRNLDYRLLLNFNAPSCFNTILNQEKQLWSLFKLAQKMHDTFRNRGIEQHFFTIRPDFLVSEDWSDLRETINKDFRDLSVVLVTSSAKLSLFF